MFAQTGRVQIFFVFVNSIGKRVRLREFYMLSETNLGSSLTPNPLSTAQCKLDVNKDVFLFKFMVQLNFEFNSTSCVERLTMAITRGLNPGLQININVCKI